MQTDFDGLAARSVEHVGEFHGGDAVDFRRGVTPDVDDIRDGRFALVARQQIKIDREEMRAGIMDVRIVRIVDGDGFHQIHSFRLVLIELFVDRFRRLHDDAGDTFGFRKWRSGRELHTADNRVAVGLRERPEFQIAGGEHRHGENKNAKCQGENDIALPYGGACDLRDDAVAEEIDGGVNTFAEAVRFGIAVMERVGKMLGQDEEGFEKADAQNDDEHGRNLDENLADVAFEEHQRSKYANRCGETGNDAGSHFLRAVDSRLDGCLATLQMDGDVV